MSQYTITIQDARNDWPVVVAENVLPVQVLEAFVVGGGGGGGPVAWNDITGKPSTFPPTLPIAWADLTGIPSTFAPSAHASSHVTGGADKIRNASASQDGLMTTAYAAKLDGIAPGANQYVHPNHSGDVTSAGDGATTITNGAVTFAKMANVSGTILIGRHAGGSGSPQEVGLDGGLEFHGSGIRRAALTGDVTAPAGSNTTTIANDAVTNAKAANMAEGTVKARLSSGSGDPEDVTLAALLTALAVPAGYQPTMVWASQIIRQTTNGPGVSTTQFATNGQTVDFLDFDTATQETATVNVVTPSGWTGSTFTVVPVWTAGSGSGGVVWGFSARVYADGEAIDASWGTEQTSTDTFQSANQTHYGPATSAITPAGTAAANRLVAIRVRRNVSDGADDLGVDARLIGFLVIWA